ncbi:MAG TPA: HlyD family efflux transporter periplasmic adaptor subunit, partial [Vicinamibacteria bacterium]|nr:HlyD family efflux transporter periplasmic adaptor subunit [Vicinamibacteria bacterium]
GQVVARFDESAVARELLEGEIALAMSDRKIEQRGVRKDSSLAGVEGDRRLAALELEFARRFGQKDPEIFSRVDILESRIDERLAAEKLSNADGREQTEVKLAESEIAMLSIEKEVAATKTARARQALEALEVRAPHDGILVLVRDWRGFVARPGDTTYSGEPIAEIPAIDGMEASVFVLEADAGGLKEGSRATVRIEGRGGEPLAATVLRVDRMPKPRLRGDPVQYFAATLELDRDDSLKPGQRVVAKLTLDEVESALVVPRQAVFEENGGRFVYRFLDGHFEKTTVSIGPPSLGRIVIESGLSEGDVLAARDPGLARSEVVPATPERGSAP